MAGCGNGEKEDINRHKKDTRENHAHNTGICQQETGPEISRNAQMGRSTKNEFDKISEVQKQMPPKHTHKADPIYTFFIQLKA